MSEEVDGGSNNPKYCAVQDTFDKLALTFEQVFPVLISKLFTKKIVSCHEYDVARDGTQPVYDRATDLLRAIMKKIEGDRLDFEAFVSVLQEFSEFSGLVDKLEAVVLLEASSIASAAAISPEPALDSDSNSNSRLVHDSSLIVVKDMNLNKPDDNVSLFGRCEPQELESEVEGTVPSNGVTEVATQNRSEVLVMTQPPSVPIDSQQETMVQQATTERQFSDETVPSFKTTTNSEQEGYIEIRKLKSALKRRSGDIEALSRQSDERSKCVDAIRAEKKDIQSQWASEGVMESMPSFGEDRLQNLKAFETREQEALLDLDDAKDQLAKSKVEKERLNSRIHELQLSIEVKKRKETEAKLKQAVEELASAKEEIQRIKEKYQKAKAEIGSLKEDRVKSLTEKEEVFREREKNALRAAELALKEKEMALADKEELKRELSELKEKHRQVVEDKPQNATLEKRESDSEIAKESQE